MRKILISAFIQFDQRFSYYDTSHGIIVEDENDNVFGDLWNETNDKKFGKIIIEKQTKKKDPTFTYFIFQSQEEPIATDRKKKGNNNNLI